ncbi:aminopeptidase P family protein [Pinisolibacter sp.]|mgnify:FL=1|uniref:aminopeptidase P family protein n=1 Tax=Pinisolibacter sp. TaxID=2172024 RepID=UPI002FDE4F9C
MFQSFDTHADPTVGAPRTALLRAELARLGLTGFLVPRADEFQSEYVAPSAERLRWLTGFSGSAGAAVVLAEKATILVDGRYRLQVGEEVDTTVFTPGDIVATPPHVWLKAEVSAGDRIGYDPWLHTVAGVRRLREAVEAAGGTLAPVEPNPLDTVWSDRPAPPTGPLVVHPAAVAGEDVAEKFARIAPTIAGANADHLLLVQPDSIAWIFNIRGRDIPHNPVPLAHALLPREGRAMLFVAPEKLSEAVAAHLAPYCDLASPAELLPTLARLGEMKAKVLFDPAWTSEILARRLAEAGATLVEGDDPITLPKARKNDTEIAGARAAHIRDGVAMARFLAWFDAEGHTTDEITCCEKLEGCRAATGELLDLSFPTISGAGPNGAIVHYHSSRATNRPIDRDCPFLLDSGAQYRDGTTDVTRTIAVGTPSAAMKRAFTLVLKGHIAISTARFPVGTPGSALDTLARIALWKAGLDYDHGTGHGVGSHMSVHEGPQRISKTGTVALEPGMILSNEPGYYMTGAYGIRIENLELVHEARKVDGGERPMLGFETLTLVPIDTRLIDASLMSRDDLRWLDAYHARVETVIGPLLDAETRAWLTRACAPLERSAS